MTNLLPLGSWCRIMGFNPFYFFGLGDSTLLKPYEGCSPLTRQYPWQNSDAASRTEIAAAIATAEQRLFDKLDFWPAPAFVRETVLYPWQGQGWGRWASVQLAAQHVQAIGVETHALIAAANAVTYTDSDGDGYMDTFSIGPVATTVTDPDEIAVYFAAVDRFDGPDFSTDVGERWRIQPVRVTLAGGNVTVKGPAWLLVKPITYEGVTNIGANGLAPATAASTPAHFATTLDLYRHYADAAGTTAATAAATIAWETRPCHGAWCCCDGCSQTTTQGSVNDPSAIATALARVGLRDPEHGIVSLGEATYNTTTGLWEAACCSSCDMPDRATISYQAGIPLDSRGQMDLYWQTIVARFAAAELARPICGCDDANRELARWQFDLARTSGAGDEAYGAISQDDLNNPFGTRRGHVFAWRAIQNPQQWRGFLV
jgi:hypothetical protein